MKVSFPTSYPVVGVSELNEILMNDEKLVGKLSPMYIL